MSEPLHAKKDIVKPKLSFVGWINMLKCTFRMQRGMEFDIGVIDLNLNQILTLCNARSSRYVAHLSADRNLTIYKPGSTVSTFARITSTPKAVIKEKDGRLISLVVKQRRASNFLWILLEIFPLFYACLSSMIALTTSVSFVGAIVFGWTSVVCLLVIVPLAGTEAYNHQYCWGQDLVSWLDAPMFVKPPFQLLRIQPR